LLIAMATAISDPAEPVMTRQIPTWIVAPTIAVFLLVPALGARQQSPVAASAPALTIGGDVPRPVSLTAADLRSMPRTRVEHKEKDGTRVYEGVLVSAVLELAGVALGERLRGKGLASYVLASARDGYQVVFSLAELDPSFMTNEVIVADTVDGAPVGSEVGPLRIVAPKESRGSRSIRMLERLEIVQLRR
jgi:hypothetical protein